MKSNIIYEAMSEIIGLPVAAAAVTPFSSARISAFSTALDNARGSSAIPDRSAACPNT